MKCFARYLFFFFICFLLCLKKLYLGPQWPCYLFWPLIYCNTRLSHHSIIARVPTTILIWLGLLCYCQRILTLYVNFGYLQQYKLTTKKRPMILEVRLNTNNQPIEQKKNKKKNLKDLYVCVVFLKILLYCIKKSNELLKKLNDICTYTWLNDLC